MMDIAKKPDHKKYFDLFGKIDSLVEEADKFLAEDYEKFASSFEGISVLLSKVEEVELILKSVKKLYGEAWEGVKAEDFNAQLPNVSKLYLKALYLIKESLHVASLAEKYYKYLQENNPQKAMTGQVNLMEMKEEAGEKN